MGSDVNMVKCCSVAASPTIPELISQLRTSFSAVEFQNAATTLVEREDRLKKQYIEVQKKAKEFEKAKDVLFLEKQKLSNEVKKKQKEIEALKKETTEYKDRIKVQNSEKSRVSKSELEGELKSKQSEVDELKKLNAAQCEELRFYKKQSADLRQCILKMDKPTKESTVSAGSPSINSENKHQKNSVSENSKPPLFGEKGDKKNCTEPKIQGIIQIDDDDDDDLKSISTKRKRVSNEIKIESNNSDFGTQNPKDLKDLHKNQPIVPNTQSTPQSSEIKPHVKKLKPKNLMHSLESSPIDALYMSLIANANKKKVKKHEWESMDAMFEGFSKDDELCMHAICALKRSGTDLPLLDTSRINELGKLLTDGDLQQKLKKTASELNQSDIDDCRRFAWRYSDQLFKIYKKKTDPFFPP